MSMYRRTGSTLSNEQLARRMQEGDPQAAEQLLSQNEGYLTMLAQNHCGQIPAQALLEDLKQEGALMLLEAAQRFDPSQGTKLLTYATPAIVAAMQDCTAQNSFSLSLPLDRYYQLQQVASLCATHAQDSMTDLLTAIQERLKVSDRVARRLLEEYRTVFRIETLGERVFDLGCGGDPARAFEQFMRRTLLLQRMEDVLTPRELILVRCYLGIGQPNEQGMTFQELAIRLNYNGPSSAEKAYKNAIRKLRKQLHGGAYGQWCSIQRAIQDAHREAGQEIAYCSPQITWREEQKLVRGFLCRTAALTYVHCLVREALEQEEL